MQGRVMSVCISAVEVVWMPNQKLRRCCLDVAMCQATLARHYGIWVYVPVRVLGACLACRLCCFIVKCLFFCSGVVSHCMLMGCTCTPIALAATGSTAFHRLCMPLLDNQH
jgi:hypothetical protein